MNQVTYAGGRMSGHSEVMKSRIRSMAQEMKKSMLASFDTATWTSCGISHPEVEKKLKKERERTERHEYMRMISQDLKGLTARWQATDKVVLEQADEADIAKNREFAGIASRAGMTLLDVEELDEVWAEYFPHSDRFDPEDSDFLKLVRSLYSGLTSQELRRLVNYMGKAKEKRTKSEQVEDADQSATWEFGNAPEKSLFIFEDFVIGFGKWLSRQEPTAKLGRCKLTRFHCTLIDRLTQELATASAADAADLVDVIAKRLADCRTLVAVNDLQSESLFDLSLRFRDHMDESKKVSQRQTARDPEDWEDQQDSSAESSSSSGSSWGSLPMSPATSMAKNMSLSESWNQAWKVAKYGEEAYLQRKKARNIQQRGRKATLVESLRGSQKAALADYAAHLDMPQAQVPSKDHDRSAGEEKGREHEGADGFSDASSLPSNDSVEDDDGLDGMSEAGSH
jgi:hypothetical protein